MQKTSPKPRILVPGLIVLILCLGLLISRPAKAEKNIRQPSWAGKFYPSDPKELRDMLDHLSQKASYSQKKIPKNKHLKALIMPHAGYIYSGPIAIQVGQVLDKASFEKIIIMGPDHRIDFQNGSISSYQAYKTPLGLVPVHSQAKALRKNYNLFKTVLASEKYEHSIEVILPYLQYFLTDFQIIPIVIGSGSSKEYAKAIAPLINQSTLIVVSTDLSHYLPYSQAKKRDSQTIQMILDGQYDDLQKKANRACGMLPLGVLIQISQEKNWQPVLLDYANSGDTAGSKDKVVGYTAIAFFGGKDMNQSNQNHQIDQKQGNTLVRLARMTIAQELELEEELSLSEINQEILSQPNLQANRGTFVTLHKHGQLRGCIGSLTSDKPLVDGVKENAVNAAFNDPRFPPLSPEEFLEIDIEVSILSQPQPLNYQDPQELISYLEKNKPGLIIKKGFNQATFLPQVWEQLPKPQEFINHLCLKAGLSPNAWQEENLQVLTYQVQYFAEKQ